MEIREKIREIIGRQLETPAEGLESDIYFRSLPNVDSMRVLQIILETENTFGIEIPDDVTFRLETVGEYLDLVEELCRQGSLA
jgi:acyl carrier protein